MSTTIDNRVVEMRFDNRHFENNVQTSISTLDKLKQSLNLSGASKGLENVDAAAKKVDMSSLGSAAEVVQAKFSAMSIVATTALANITNSVVNTGKRMISALTIDPIKTGFNEYETKMGAIQTIMSNTASKGTTMEDVTKVIGELNTYADKTIYNFAEMTRNIGTFTAAGIGLEESASAIQGIANLAASSGSTSQQASTAMYQLSQALASGTVKLMDWNSVVNAGMGGQKFQDALKATARDHGIAVDALIEKNGSFRESLQEGWISADILNETLNKFTVDGAKEYAKSMMESGKWTQEQADALIKEAQSMEDAATKVKTFTQLWDTLKESAQSGWGQTWEIIVGDFEEAKETLTKFSEVIGGIISASADARNNLLQGWKDAGGRADVVDSIFNVFEGIRSVVSPIKEAFSDIFPPLTVKQLVGFTQGLKELTARMKLSSETSDKFKRTFKGVFAVLDIAKQIFSAALGLVKPLFGGVSSLSGGILEITATIGDWLVKLSEAIEKSKVFSLISTSIGKILTFVFGTLKKFINGAGDVFSSISEAASDMGSAVTSSVDSMGGALERCTVVRILKSIWNGVKVVVKGIGEALSSVFNSSAFEHVSLVNFLELLNSIIAGGVGIGILKFIKSFRGAVEEVAETAGSFKEIFGGIKDVLGAYQNQLNANALMKLAAAIAILVGSVLVLSLIDSEKLYDSVVAMGTLFAALVGAVMILNKSAGGLMGAVKSSTVMITLSLSVLMLASALKIIADVDFGQMCTGLLGVAGLMAVVVGTMKVLGKGGVELQKGAFQMVIIAAAIKILASACEDLSYLSFGDMVKGLFGVGVLLTGVSLFLNNTKFSGKAIFTATGVVLLAAAMKIFASACADFGSMDLGGLVKGLGSIAVLLAAIVGFTKLTSNAKSLISTGIAMVAIAAGIKIFASAMMDLSGISWNGIFKGLTAIAVTLIAVAGAVQLMPTNLISTGVGLAIVSASLLMLASVFTSIGGISWDSVAKSLVSIIVALYSLAGALRLMNGTLAGSAALLVAAGALAVIAPVLKSMGSMSWSSIAKGLILLAGAFVIIGVAGKVLGPITPAIIKLAGAIALIGVGILALGVGLVAAGAGLTAIAAGIIAIVAALVSVQSNLVSVVTEIAKSVASAIVVMASVLADNMDVISKLIKSVVLALCEILVECTPVLAETVMTVIMSLLDALVNYTPRIVDALFRFVIGILQSLGDNIPKFIQAVVDLFVKIFEGAIEALGSLDTSSMIKGLAAIGLMAGIVIALAAISALIPAAMIGVAGMGLVISELAIVLAAVGALAAIPGLKWLISEGGDLLGTIGTAIGNFIGGLAGGIAASFSNSLPDIASNLSIFMTNLKPFIDGAKSIDPSTLDGVKSLVGIIFALTAANIVDGIASWITGGSSITKFAEEIPALGYGLKSFADSVDGINPENVTAAVEAARKLAEMTSVIPNEGGMVAWFTGENSISKFGDELPALGAGLKGFSDAIVGIVPENIVAASNAAKALADMTAVIPNAGGMASWFAGENSVSAFASEIVTLGYGIRGFSDAVSGVVPDNIVAAANAAKALAEMTSVIPNEGGMKAWFTGENSIANFAADIIILGGGLKGFSDAVMGVVPENVLAGANAAKALAEMTAIIPNEGGIKAWFVGESSISNFAGQLPMLGLGLKGFSDAVAGVNQESMIAAANAAKALAEMVAVIPNEGGIKAWFTGESSISKFSVELATLGVGLKGFSQATAGINPESMVAASNAAKNLAEMTSYIPNEGGMKAWFTGETSIASFSNNLTLLGKGLAGFSQATSSINAETTTAAAGAAKSLAEMTQHIPTEGGIKAWFTGETSIATFADKLPTLGAGLKGFSDSVAGINPENTTAAADAAKSLGQMTETVPKDSKKIISFGENLKKFGTHLASYFDKTKGITAESTSAASKAIDVVKDAAAINSSNLSSLATSINNTAKALKNLSNIPKNCTKNFANALKDLGESSTKSFLKAFDTLGDDIKKKIDTAMEAFISAVEDNSDKCEKAFVNVVKACADAVSEKSSLFKSAGKDLVIGMANGISSNSYRAEAKAKAMAKAAALAAERALDINSPSKVGYGIGNFFGMGFVNAISDYTSTAYDSSFDMATEARNGLSDAINKIRDFIDSDMDTQPTIRPVLDLSSVESGANRLGNMFGATSVGVLTNLNAINSSMNHRGQNGANGEVVSAINELRKSLGNVGNTYYTIDGITYDDGSNISEAVSTLVRAAKVGRRT